MLTEPDLAYTLTQLQQLAGQAHRQYHRLVLLGGGDWQTRTQVLQAAARRLDWPYLVIGQALAGRLSQRTPQQRPLRLEQEMEALLPAGAGIVLDQLEILFDADLHANPLPLLERISRQKAVLAGWPGPLSENKLVYAEPWHAEYRALPLGERLCYALP